MKFRIVLLGLFGLLLITVTIVPIQARTIDRCGTYIAEGYFTKASFRGQERRAILMDRGSRSEVTFIVRGRPIPDTQLGASLRLKLKFVSSCWYYCEGEIVEIIAPLDPLQAPESFVFPRPILLKGSEIRCQQTSSH